MNDNSFEGRLFLIEEGFNIMNKRLDKIEFDLNHLSDIMKLELEKLELEMKVREKDVCLFCKCE